MSVINKLKSSIPYSARWWLIKKFFASLNDATRHEVQLLTNKIEKDRVFVFTPYDDWNSIKQRHHHMAVEISRKGELVLFGSRKKKDRFKGCINKVSDNLYLYCCDPVELVLFLSTKKRVYVISYYPYWGKVFAELADGEKIISVFDAIDHPLIYKIDAGWKRAVEDFDYALEKSTHVFCASQALSDYVSSRREERWVVIENGVTENFFINPEKAFDIKSLVKNNRKNVMFHGVFSRWIDFRLLESVVTGIKNVNFVFMGYDMYGQFKNYILSKNLKNVFFLGFINYEDLPSYIRSADAGLLPFKMDEVGRCASPVKLLEYYAAGVPVISTPLPYSISKQAFIASNPEDFIKKIKEALNEKARLSEVLRSIALDHLWSKKAEEMIAYLLN